MDPHDWRIIKSTPLFGAMPDDAMSELIGHECAKVYEKGTVLFQQGEAAQAFFVVLDGWVKVYRLTAEGEESVVCMFSRGETFAEAAIFLGGHYPVSAEIVSPTRLVRIDGDIMRRKIHKDPDLALSMLASSSQHLKNLVVQLEKMKVLSAPRRVADFLVRLCKCVEGTCTIELPYEKALIANRLGMKPESFSRVLNKLRPLGITVEGDHVKIEDIQALAVFAETGQAYAQGSKSLALQLD